MKSIIIYIQLIFKNKQIINKLSKISSKAIDKQRHLAIVVHLYNKVEKYH